VVTLDAEEELDDEDDEDEEDDEYDEDEDEEVEEEVPDGVNAVAGGGVLLGYELTVMVCLATAGVEYEAVSTFRVSATLTILSRLWTPIQPRVLVVFTGSA